MEFDLLLLSPIEAIAALLTLAFLFYLFVCSKKSSKPPLPPEIAGGWPVIGHLFYFENDGDDRPFARKLSDLADKYGPVFTFRLGLPRVLVISSYDAVKDCYSKNDAVFANRPACLYGEYAELNFGLIVKMIAGKNYESGGDGDGEVERFKNAFRKFLVLSMEFVLWDAFPIPLFKWIDFQGHVKLMKKTFKDIDEIFPEMVR